MTENSGIDWLNVVKRIANTTKTDLVIKTHLKDHLVHKIILTSASSFFKKACNGTFKEAQSDIIELHHDNSYAVDAMISYLYTGQFDGVVEQLRFAGDDTCWEQSLGMSGECIWEKGSNGLDIVEYFIPFHIAVYVLSDKYGLWGLQEKAAHEIRDAVDVDPSPSWSLEQLERIIDLLNDVTGDAIDCVAAPLSRVIEPSKEFSNSLDVMKCARQWSELSYQWMMRQRDRRAIEQAYVRNHGRQYS